MQESIWPAIIIVGLLFIAGMATWVRDKYTMWKARQKSIASEPIDSIPFVYDCSGRIKRYGDELRELTRKKGGQ